jgi:oxygen-independent coproporphyrinogen-3 oxidase
MIDLVDVPLDLVERYRTRAPRYTSYPTAPHFGPVDTASVDTALGCGDGPLSLYVHIPFCRSLCSYCGCHVEIRSQRSVGVAYVDVLLAELDLVVARLRPGRSLAQVALGGGTPTFLEPDDMTRLLEGIRARLPFAPGVDASIEIDPRTVDGAYLDRLVDLGFTRFSFGVQDLDPAVLDAVNRSQPADLVWRAVEHLRGRGDFDINLDLMYGLPHQTEATFARTIDAVAGLRPTRVALFHYAHVPWMKPAQKLVERAGLPTSDTKSRLFSLAGHGFEAAGYVPIGMDHFALPGDALVAAALDGTLQRNFMGYTTRAGLDQVGIGVSAIGFFGGMYAQDLKDREAWTRSVEAGRLPIERGLVLSPDDAARRTLIMDLFCNFHARFNEGDYAGEMTRLAPLEADGLVVLRPGGVDVTPLGRHFIRNVCAVFDRYLESDVATRRYSATA